MFDYPNLKVAVFCRESLQVQLETCLSDNCIQAVFFSNLDTASDEIQYADFDLVLIDCGHPSASVICDSVNFRTRIPVALLVKGNSLSWSEFSNWQVDGFIPAEAGCREFLARIRAIARRPVKSVCLSGLQI
jgi:DNA-binding response OmpR family regulator